MMKKQLNVSTENRKYLARIFRVSLKTIYYALNFDPQKGFTKTAERIRVAAYHHGGELTCTLPACETIHDANGIMTQTFQNNVKIIVDKKTGNADVVYQDKILRSMKNCTITELNELQQFAAEYKKGE